MIHTKSEHNLYPRSPSSTQNNGARYRGAQKRSDQWRLRQQYGRYCLQGKRVSRGIEGKPHHSVHILIHIRLQRVGQCQPRTFSLLSSFPRLALRPLGGLRCRWALVASLQVQRLGLAVARLGTWADLRGSRMAHSSDVHDTADRRPAGVAGCSVRRVCEAQPGAWGSVQGTRTTDRS